MKAVTCVRGVPRVAKPGDDFDLIVYASEPNTQITVALRMDRLYSAGVFTGIIGESLKRTFFIHIPKDTLRELTIMVSGEFDGEECPGIGCLVSVQTVEQQIEQILLYIVQGRLALANERLDQILSADSNNADARSIKFELLRCLARDEINPEIALKLADEAEAFVPTNDPRPIQLRRTILTRG